MTGPSEGERQLNESPRPRRRWLRRASIFAASLVGSAALILLAASLLPRSERFRRAALARVTDAVGVSLGIEAVARDFSLDLSARRLVLHDVALARPGADGPFLRVPMATADFTWRGLLGAPRVIDALVLDDAVWDMDRPLSAADGAADVDAVVADEPQADGPAALEVTKIVVHRGSVVSSRPPPGFEDWIESWRWHGLEGGGAFRDGFRLLFAAAPLTLGAAEAGSGGLVDPLPALALAGGFDWQPDGAWRFEKIALEGEDALHLDASGAGRFGAGERFDLDIDLGARLGRWLAGVPPPSHVRARGTLELNELVGTVRVEARQLPGEVVGPWLGELDERLALAGTDLALDADLVLGGRDPTATHGTARLVWRRGDAVLLDVEGAVAAPSANRDSIRLGFEARMLPDGPDTITARGTLAVPSLNGFDRLRLDAVEVGLRTDDARALAERLNPWAPGVVAAIPSGFLEGQWTIEGRLDGRARAPAVAFTAGWIPSPDARVDLDASVDLAAAQARIDLAATRFDVGRLFTAWPGPVIDEGRLLISVEGEAMTIETFELEADDGRTLAVRGSAAFERTAGWSTARLAEADLRVEAVAPVAGIDHLAASLRLAGGVVQLDVDPAHTATGGLTVEATVPLTALAAWPAVADRIGDRVVGGAKGPVVVTARLPALDTAAWARAVGTELPAGLAGDAMLTLALDPADPASGRGLLRVRDAVVRRDDQTLRARSPLRLVLEDGVLRLDSVAFEAAGAVATLSARTVLDPAWRPHDVWHDVFGPIAMTATARGGGEERLQWSTVAALLGVDPAGVAASAEVMLEARVDAARLRSAEGFLTLSSIEASVGGEAVHVDDLRLRLEAGTLALAPARIRAGGQLVELAARAQVRSSQQHATVASWLEHVEVTLRAGPAFLGAEAPALDPGRIGQILAAAQPPPADSADDDAPAGSLLPAEAITSSLDARLLIDLDDPWRSEGEVTLPGFRLSGPAHQLAARDPLRIVLVDRRLTLARATLEDTHDHRPFHLEASARLAAGVASGASGSAWVEDVSLRADGTLDAALVNPFLSNYLPGVAARGPLGIDMRADGALDALRGHLRLTAPDAECLLTRPYFTRVADIDLALVLADGTVTVERGEMTINEGHARITGQLDRQRGLELGVVFDHVRYRFDYGLTVSVDGALTFSRPPTGTARLSGAVSVEQGSIRRYLDADRELIRRLFAGTPAVSAGASALADVALDVDVRTERGVRIKNNLADLRAFWNLLELRGTLAAPRIAGRIDTDPGGFLFAYGQTLRLDRASLTWSGDPEAEPDLDFVFTSAAQDPSVAREGASRFPAALRPDDGDPSAASAQDPLTTGVASYYLDRLAGQVGTALGSLDLTVGQDLLVFGEADPATRLTVGQDISPNVSIAASLALQDEGDTTYVLDLHGFAPVDHLVAQVFTTDEQDQGATIQQVLELGGRQTERGWPRLRSIRIRAPEAVVGRGLRRAVGYEKGDLIPPGADFEIELDVAEYLRRRGFPGAEVKVRVVEERPAGVAIDLEVEPGPHVVVTFEGDRPSSFARRAIRTIYRPDLYEPATLEEVHREAVRALELEGFLEPEVEVVVETPSDDPDAPRTVVVRSRGGVRQKLELPLFEGVDEETAARLSARLGDMRSRIGLARNEASQRQQVVATLADLAYPDARVAPVTMRQGRPVVVIVPGERSTFSALRIDGLASERAHALVPDLGVAVGDPARRDKLIVAAARLERALRAEGSIASRVHGEIDATAEDGPIAVLRVTDPQPYALAEIRFEDRGRTKHRWAERATKLEKGGPLREKDVARARRELYEVGAFSAVVPRTELRDDGTGIVVFDLEEGPRYRLAVGGRWSSSEGLASVVDVLDRNALGRGIRLGVRATLAKEDQSGRFFASLPNIFGTKASLDLFVGGRDRTEDGVATSSIGATLQVSVPHGRHTSTRYYVRYGDQRTVSTIDLPIVGPLEIVDRTKLPMLGFQWLRDRRDDRIEPRRGSFVSLDLSGTGSVLSSDFSYLRLLARGSLFRTIGHFRSRPIVWAQSLHVGLADTFDDTRLLRSQRFFAGGEYSVRGYEEDSLGLSEPLGDDRDRAAGGEALLAISQELRIPLAGSLLGVLFADAGNVYENVDELGDELFIALGLGVRVRTPVGLLRGDIAFPLDRREDDDDVQLYLGFGYTF